jgi:hypothetical protein
MSPLLPLRNDVGHGEAAMGECGDKGAGARLLSADGIDVAHEGQEVFDLSTQCEAVTWR